MKPAVDIESYPIMNISLRHKTLKPEKLVLKFNSESRHGNFVEPVFMLDAEVAGSVKGAEKRLKGGKENCLSYHPFQ